MPSLKTQSVTAICLLLFASQTFAQRMPRATVCKQDVLAALKPLPDLAYDCPVDVIDSDENVLNLPARAAAIKIFEQKLAAFNEATWWQANVDDLNICDLHGSAGELTNEEREKLKGNEYQFRLFGDRQFRLVLTADPYYQTGYNGTNAFLLYRKEEKVFVSQVLNGYYSRIDNSVGMTSANLNGQSVIEISTANSMSPEFTNYYFGIDPRTNRAIPRKIFKDGQRLTNQISSAMLFSEPGPKDAAEMTVIRRNQLASAFSVYADDDRGKIDDNGRKLRRIVYRWNGRFYSRAK